MAILRTYYNPEMFDDEYALSPSGTYKCPPDGDHESFISFVTDGMPAFQMAEVFGFHENACITKDLNDTASLYNTILKTQSSDSGGGGDAKSPEDAVCELAVDIAKKMPDVYDLDEAGKTFPISRFESMNTFVCQEFER